MSCRCRVRQSGDVRRVTRNPIERLRTRLAAVPPGRLVLLLDFDGTLAPIVENPAAVRLSPSLRRTLRRLVRAVPVVIISGRGIPDLRRRVRVPGIRFVGHHGLVYHAPGHRLRWLGHRAPVTQVRQWARVLTSVALGTRGALVEFKRWTVAVHDRSVLPATRGSLRRRMLRALKPWRRRRMLMLIRGKRVLEARPFGSWNKGTAVSFILREPWARGRTPVYFGDDATDEPAFRAIRGRGIGVRVGHRRRHGPETMSLRNTAAVASLLEWLARRSAPVALSRRRENVA